MLQLKVLISKLGQKPAIHLVQSSNSSFVSLDETILSIIEKFSEVCEVHLVKLGFTSENVMQKVHESLSGNVVFTERV